MFYNPPPLAQWANDTLHNAIQKLVMSLDKVLP
jgi:hypothetical protein